MANGNNKSEVGAIFQLDLDWQRQRETYLDWGREPQTLTVIDVVVTSLFFLFTWGAALWLGHGDWSLGAAAIAIAVLFSFRSRAFESAYRGYLHARSRLAQLLATG
ncbi:MAG TPA: hypothetical protein PK867_18020 [Pirellulales bacterium]|nr:hypothetical protein [Pirellulales bacterium]